MESNPEGNEIIYGPKDFSYDIKSQISSILVRDNEKDNIELVNKLISKFTLIDSEEKLQMITNSKQEQTAVVEPVKEEEEEEETKPQRNLFEISASKTFNLASFDVVGKKVSVKYVVGISSKKAYNKIVISCDGGSFEFGNTGCSASYNFDKSYSQPLFIFYCPPPYSFVSVRLYAKGKVSGGIGVKSGKGTSTKYWAKASGSLKLGAEAVAGFDKIASLSAFAEGTVVNVSGQVTLSKGSVSKDSGFRLSMGQIEVGIKGSFAGKSGTLWSKVVFKGWSQ